MMKKIMSVSDFKFEQGVLCNDLFEVGRMRTLMIRLGKSCFVSEHQLVFFPNEKQWCDYEFAKERGFNLVNYSDIIILEDYFRDIKIDLKDFGNREIVCHSSEEWELLCAYAASKGFKWRSGKDLKDYVPSTSFNGITLAPTKLPGVVWGHVNEAPLDQFIYFADWVRGSTEFVEGSEYVFPNGDTKQDYPIPLIDFEKHWCIWCATVGEWDRLMQYAEKAGLVWASGQKVSKRSAFISSGTGITFDIRKSDKLAVYETNLYDPDLWYIRLSDWEAGRKTFSIAGIDSPEKIDIMDTTDVTNTQLTSTDAKTLTEDYFTCVTHSTQPFCYFVEDLLDTSPVSPAKKEKSMLAPFVFVSSAVRRASWSVFDWAFVSPLKKTVKPVGTVAQFTICYTTLAFLGYLSYSAYNDPQAVLTWISDLSPIEVKFKDAE
jgi:hypothetical protein